MSCLANSNCQHCLALHLGDMQYIVCGLDEVMGNNLGLQLQYLRALNNLLQHDIPFRSFRNERVYLRGTSLCVGAAGVVDSGLKGTAGGRGVC